MHGITREKEIMLENMMVTWYMEGDAWWKIMLKLTMIETFKHSIFRRMCKDLPLVGEEVRKKDFGTRVGSW